MASSKKRKKKYMYQEGSRCRVQKACPAVIEFVSEKKINSAVTELCGFIQ